MIAESPGLGAIRNGSDIGRSSRHKFVWRTCPRCGENPRWVRLDRRTACCRKCGAKVSGRGAELEAVQGLGRERHRYLVELGRAAESAGLDLDALLTVAEQRR